MYLIAGLGNPGEKYRNTRHNVGFVAVDYIAATLGVKVNKIKFRALIGETSVAGEKVILAKPSTYMNLSGESILAISEYYKIPAENIIIIYDDVSLPPGRLRIRPDGSDGGHNGIKSILYHLQTDAFPRIKIGLGKNDIPLADYVLGTFSKQEGIAVTSCIKYTDKICETIIASGVGEAMNKFNGVGK